MSGGSLDYVHRRMQDGDLIVDLTLVHAPTTVTWASDPCPSRTSPLWYLSWPTPVIDLVRGNPMNATWFCLAGKNAVHETEVVGYGIHQRTRTYVVDFCGAPPGVRCSCGTQLAGHDPGDEQP